MALMIVGVGLLAIGLILTLVGWLVLTVIAFRQSPSWGVGVLIFEPVKWVFVSRYWKKAKNGFVTQVCGWAAGGLGTLLIFCGAVTESVTVSHGQQPQPTAQAKANPAAAEPAKPAQPAGPAKPAKPAQPAGPAKTAKPAEPAKTAKKSPKRPARQTLSAEQGGEAPPAEPAADSR